MFSFVARSLAIQILFGMTVLQSVKAEMVQLNALNEQVLDLFRQGQYVEAEKTAKRVRVLAMKKFGPEHPNVGTSFHNLAMIYEAQGRHLEVVPLLERAIVIFTKLNVDTSSAIGPAFQFFRSIPDRRTHVAKHPRLRQRKNLSPVVAEGSDDHEVAMSRQGSVGSGKKSGRLKKAALQSSPEPGETERQSPIVNSSLPFATAVEASVTQSLPSDESGDAVAAIPDGNNRGGKKRKDLNTAALQYSPQPAGATKRPFVAASLLRGGSPAGGAVTASAVLDEDSREVIALPDGNVRADKKKGGLDKASLQKSPETDGAEKQSPTVAMSPPGVLPDKTPIAAGDAPDHARRKAVTLNDESTNRLKVALPRKLPRPQNVEQPGTIVASLMPVALPNKAPSRSLKFDLPPLPVLGARIWNEAKPSRTVIARRQLSQSSRSRRRRLRGLPSGLLPIGFRRPIAVDRPRPVIAVRPLIR